MTRIAIHDYAGHLFQLELSRTLAREGHNVEHLYCASNTTPQAVHGALATPGLQLTPLSLRRHFDKYSPIRRLLQELELGWLVVSRLKKRRPEVLVSSNVPLFTHLVTLLWARIHHVRTVFWAQDLQSGLMRHAIGHGWPVRQLLGTPVENVEAFISRHSSHVVAISDAIADTLASWRVEPTRVTVAENWAPLDDLPTAPRNNWWSEAQGLCDKTVFLYSGSLGLKHDPDLLIGLAHHYANDPAVRVVVVSEGAGATWLREQKRADRLENLVLLPFQPFDQLPLVLASGDVLVTLLEQSAGAFSVPSKVLSYHCAARPILASIPQKNSAARMVLG